MTGLIYRRFYKCIFFQRCLVTVLPESIYWQRITPCIILFTRTYMYNSCSFIWLLCLAGATIHSLSQEIKGNYALRCTLYALFIWMDKDLNESSTTELFTVAVDLYCLLFKWSWTSYSHIWNSHFENRFIEMNMYHLLVLILFR